MIELDERISSGMRDLLALRDERLRTGERQIGWKVGFGSPAAAAMLGIDRPLVGVLMESGLLPDGADVPIGSWTAPMLEPEIAVVLDADVERGASWDEVRAAIGGLGPAIELADVDPPPSDVRAILAGNVFHRHVVLGPVDASRSDARGIGGSVTIDGAVAAETEDPEPLTGEMVEVVRLTAELLDACGQHLRAGEVVITGSVVPPVPVAPGQAVSVTLGELGSLALSLTS